MSELVRFAISIEKKLFDKLERFVDSSDYGNRSEFVRSLVRKYLVEQEWQSDQILLGTITIVFDHHARDLHHRLQQHQHDFAGRILATTHIHLDHHTCAEMIMVQGKGQEIKELAYHLQREKGVLHATLTTSTLGKNLQHDK